MSASSDEESSTYKLNKKFFISLLSAETQFQTKICSMTQILSLLDMYAKCVEFFDALGNPAKWYFIEKISQTIAEKEAFELILQEESDMKIKREKAQKIKPIQKITNNQHNPLARPIIQSKQKKQPEMQINPKVTQFKEDEPQIDVKHVSLHRIRDLRQKKLTFTEKIFENKEKVKKDMSLVDQWKNETDLTDSFIRQQFDIQDQLFSERLYKRKERIRSLHGVNSIRNIPNE